MFRTPPPVRTGSGNPIQHSNRLEAVGQWNGMNCHTSDSPGHPVLSPCYPAVVFRSAAVRVRRLLQATLISVAMLPVSAFGQDASPREDATEQSQSVVKPLEDNLAKVINGVRASNNLPALNRIKRTDLLQQTCSVALADKVPRPGYGSLFAGEVVFYKTVEPTGLTSELSKIVSKPSKMPQYRNDWPYKRFSVAIWPAPSSDSGHREYWVGVGLYISAGTEFIDNWLTDDAPYRGYWKKSINPNCRKVH
jgi:hypothetical protein